MTCRTACLLAALTLAACAEPAEPDPVVEADTGAVAPAEPAVVIEGADEILGEWVITEQTGAAPEGLYFVTLGRDGSYLIRNEAGTTKRATFRLDGEGMIAVTDSAGTHRFAYDVEGDLLTLSVLGAETRTVMERRSANF
ncbi:MAG: hypothetical protein AAGI91_11055 [Bacteroidota bacterium]